MKVENKEVKCHYSNIRYFLYGLVNHDKKSAQNKIKFACLRCMLPVYYMLHTTQYKFRLSIWLS
jgi:hypothetical protein